MEGGGKKKANEYNKRNETRVGSRSHIVTGYSFFFAFYLCRISGYVHIYCILISFSLDEEFNMSHAIILPTFYMDVLFFFFFFF